MNQIFPQESDHPLFRYFTQEERTTVEGMGRQLRIPEGGYLIRQGELDSAMFAVEDGTLEIVGMRGDEPAVFATIGPGDVIGEISFIDDSPRSVSVRAAEDALVTCWDKKSLSESLAFRPELLAKFSIALCELLVERLRESVRRQNSHRAV